MEKDSSQQPQAVFSSNEIGRKGKTNYFTNIKRKRTAKETAKQLNPFKGKRKFITIPVLAVLVVGIILLLCFIFIWNKPSTPEAGGATANTPTNSYDIELSEIYTTARDKVANGDYSAAMAYIDDLISHSDDFDRRADLIFMKVNIYISFQDWQGALNVLLNMDPEALNDYGRDGYYMQLENIYRELGDNEKADEAGAKVIYKYWGDSPSGEDNEE